LSKIATILLLGVTIFLLGGCTAFKGFSKQDQNITRPIDNTTYFTEAFKRLNHLLMVFQKPRYTFQVKNIDNLTSAKQAMPSDSKNFIKTPLILHMSGLELLAYEPIYHQYEAKTTGFLYFPDMKKNMPQLVIDGAVTQFDKGILSQSSNLDVDLEFGAGRGDTDFRYDHDRGDDLSQIALDLSVFKYKDRSYITGVATQNKIEIHRKKRKDRFGLFLNGSGIGYSKYNTLQQSKDEALRILTEYSLIQLLGRLYEVPYWRCVIPNLEPDQNIIDKKVKFFSNSKDKMKIKLIEQLIQFYNQESVIDGVVSPQELDVLSQISGQYNIPCKSILSTDLYRKLYYFAPIFKENTPLDKVIVPASPSLLSSRTNLLQKCEEKP
jgi:hypothetical protein